MEEETGRRARGGAPLQRVMDDYPGYGWLGRQVPPEFQAKMP